MKPVRLLVLVAATLLPLLETFLAVGKAQVRQGSFPEPYNSEADPGEPPSPSEALAALMLPAGFTATLFAAEPDVQNPIAACWDARGRLWVAENYTYAERSQRFDLGLYDRIVVLEDVDGDGTADRRTVFSDSLQMLTGITVGQGGVWLMCPPQLLFIPDADDDLVPDGPAQIKLDGFHVARENYHNFANGLSWGPDNWLYGRCGASCPGEMGVPGSTSEQRVAIRGGIWRYHPQRQVVEALTQGTTNPWGHDWNPHGELFFINTVNGHLWHAITGAHFVRPHTLDSNPHAYELIDMHADHWHFDTGKSWTASRDGAANDYGGGHAHIGTMIYQEENWPASYRGRLMTVNMHGRRINVEKLIPEGSGYVGQHADDFLMSDDAWFRGMEILPAPDGNALLLDWSDTGECHEATGVHRTSGRIFKLIYGDTSSRGTILTDPAAVNDPVPLAAIQSSGSEWQARRARELLRSLRILGKAQFADVAATLESLFSSATSTPQRLRAIFALQAIDGLQPEWLLEQLATPDPHVRTWAIRLLTDSWPLDLTVGGRPADSPETLSAEQLAILHSLQDLAARESAASVRLTLASLLQRLPLVYRAKLASALMSYTEDARDHNLPLMVWYGLMPLGQEHLDQLVDLAPVSQWPTTRRLIARRVSEQADQRPAELNRLLGMAYTATDATACDIVLGIAQGLAGRRKVTMPAAWNELRNRLTGSMLTGPDLSNETSSQLRQAINDLNVLFGDGVAIKELKRLTLSGQSPLDVRMAALESLVDARADGLRELCLTLLKQRFINLIAAKGLALETDEDIGRQLLAAYRSFAPLDRPQVISILSSRKAWASALLHAVAQGQIDRHEISAYQARQIASLNDERLDRQLAESWGQVRETPAERQQQISELKQRLTPEVLSSANVAQGRSLFDKNCSSCHTLFGQGGRLGPDLTGAQRSNLDYLLENIVDPSAVVTKEFRATIVMMEDGRLLTGLLTSQTDEMVTLATQNETYRLRLEEILQVKQSTASTMPDGLLNQMTNQQIVDLFAYLQSQQQVQPAE